MAGMPYANEKWPVVQEYFVRKTLAELGYTFRGESLSYDRAEEFHMIAGELAILKKEAFDKERLKSGKKK